MTPDSGANVVTSSASTRLPCTRCSRTTLALSSGRVTRACWAEAAGTASNASAVTVSMHGGRIAPSRWTGKLTHGDRNGGCLLTVDRDVETIQPRMRARNVEHEDRAGLDLRDPRRRLGEVDVAVASQDLDVLLVEQADLHLVSPTSVRLPLRRSTRCRRGCIAGNCCTQMCWKIPRTESLPAWSTRA